MDERATRESVAIEKETSVKEGKCLSVRSNPHCVQKLFTMLQQCLKFKP